MLYSMPELYGLLELDDLAQLCSSQHLTETAQSKPSYLSVNPSLFPFSLQMIQWFEIQVFTYILHLLSVLIWYYIIVNSVIDSFASIFDHW